MTGSITAPIGTIAAIAGPHSTTHRCQDRVADRAEVEGRDDLPMPGVVELALPQHARGWRVPKHSAIPVISHAIVHSRGETTAETPRCTASATNPAASQIEV